MKFQAIVVGLFIFVAATLAQADQTLSGGDASAKLTATSTVAQHKPATVSPQAGEPSEDGNTLQMVLLTLLVMGSIALRRSGSAR